MSGTFSQDLRYAVRMLAKTPGFTLTAILTLALGIGANTAIFSVANALLLRPLPYQDADDLVIVTNARGPNRRPFSFLRATFLQQHGRSFSGFAPFISENFNVTGRGDPEQLPALRVGWNFFDVLGVHPALGHAFGSEDDRPGGQPVVLISESLWRRRFAGRSIDVWSSRAFEQNSLTPQEARAGEAYVLAVARIRRGLQLEQAQAEMEVLDAQYVREHADHYWAFEQRRRGGRSGQREKHPACGGKRSRSVLSASATSYRIDARDPAKYWKS
jgi:hypothetical protein